MLVESTLGRFLFNEAFPPDFPFHDDAVKKRDLTELASKLVEGYPRAVVAESLDKLKDLGFEFATRSGLTISISDVRTPAAKAGLLEHFEAEADKVESPVRPRRHHRRRAASEGDRGLERGHRTRP